MLASLALWDRTAQRGASTQDHCAAHTHSTTTTVSCRWLADPGHIHGSALGVAAGVAEARLAAARLAKAGGSRRCGRQSSQQRLLHRWPGATSAHTHTNTRCRPEHDIWAGWVATETDYHERCAVREYIHLHTVSTLQGAPYIRQAPCKLHTVYIYMPYLTQGAHDSMYIRVGSNRGRPLLTWPKLASAGCWCASCPGRTCWSSTASVCSSEIFITEPCTCSPLWFRQCATHTAWLAYTVCNACAPLHGSQALRYPATTLGCTPCTC